MERKLASVARWTPTSDQPRPVMCFRWNKVEFGASLFLRERQAPAKAIFQKCRAVAKLARLCPVRNLFRSVQSTRLVCPCTKTEWPVAGLADHKMRLASFWVRVPLSLAPAAASEPSPNLVSLADCVLRTLIIPAPSLKQTKIDDCCFNTLYMNSFHLFVVKRKREHLNVELRSTCRGAPFSLSPN